MTTAFFAGSFDPITLGHIALIGSGLDLFDKVIIGIGTHHEKKALFSVEERENLIERSCFDSGVDTTRLEFSSFNNLLVDAAHQAGATAILRGLRTASDFDYEIGMSDMNAQMNPKIHTVFLTSPPLFRNISSSLVRQIAIMGGDVTIFVPPCVKDALMQKLHK